MKQVFKIDSNGFYLEDVILSAYENIPSDCVEIQSTQGLCKAQFVNGVWVEGASQSDILTQSKNNKLLELNSAYSNELAGGFTTNATGTSIKFKYAEIDQLNFSKRTNAIALGISDTSFPFGTADGVITFTIDQWKVVSQDAQTHEMTVYQNLVTKRNEVEAATIIADVESVTW